MLENSGVDLIKIFLLAKERGFEDAVWKDALWDLVCKESVMGVNSSNIESNLELGCIKYLDVLDKWLGRVIMNGDLESCGGVELDKNLMELESDLKGTGIINQKKKDEGYTGSDVSMSPLEKSKHAELDVDTKCFVKEEVLIENLLMSSPVVGNLGNDNEITVVVESLETQKSVGKIFGSSMDTPALTSTCNDNQLKGAGYNGDEGNVTFESGGGQNCSELDDGIHPGSLMELKKQIVGVLDVGKSCNDDETESMVLDAGLVKKCESENEGSHSSVIRETSSCRKRKRDSMSGLVEWVTAVAKNPCDSVVSPLPEMSRWKSHGKEELWMQVLLARESLFLKGRGDSIWQKNQKMHPSLYDDHIGSSGSSYNLRERSKCKERHISGKMASTWSGSSSPGTQSGVDKSQSSLMALSEDHMDKKLFEITGLMIEKHSHKKIPLGRGFQAEVPEWTGEALESDPKWLGTQDWPVLKAGKRILIGDRIGKGRQDSCGCQVPGSIECVRFHISEKKSRMKLELGSAFQNWQFNKMGEEVTLSWTKEEEKKFSSIAKPNNRSPDNKFWDQIHKSFRSKSREELVSYYYNVFLLRRRGDQNRFTPEDINSDDDEAEPGQQETVKSKNSILYSPNKSHKGTR